MISQELPLQFPFSVLDFGLTALALICMAAMAWVFTKLAREQHKLANDAFNKMTDLLQDLTHITREVSNQMQSLQVDIAHAREEIWRNRELINRSLDREVELMRKGEDIMDQIAAQDRRARVNQRYAADAEDWRRSQAQEKGGGEEDVGSQ